MRPKASFGVGCQPPAATKGWYWAIAASRLLAVSTDRIGSLVSSVDRAAWVLPSRSVCFNT